MLNSIHYLINKTLKNCFYDPRVSSIPMVRLAIIYTKFKLNTFYQIVRIIHYYLVTISTFMGINP